MPLDASNLVWRAAEALWRALRRRGPVRDVLIRLQKHIPLQAGLGGGSADAAATLMALARLWKVPVRPAQLTDVAAALGADVPFFLSGGTALGLGPRRRGVSAGRSAAALDRAARARVWRVDGGRLQLVRLASAICRAAAAPAKPQHVPGPWPSRAAQMINDLEAPIARHHPEIDQMRTALRRAGALAAAMSGSGSTVFGLFQKRADALAAVERSLGIRLARAADRVARSR